MARRHPADPAATDYLPQVTTPAGSAPVPLADALPRGLEAVQALRPLLRERHELHGVDLLELSGRVDRLDLVDAVGLLALGQHGHAVQIQAARDGWQIAVRVDSAAAATITTDDQPERALAADDADALSRAVLRGDAVAALSVCGEFAVEIVVRLHNNAEASGAHWVATESDLQRLLSGPDWVRTVRTLDSAPQVLLVGDWQTKVLQGDGLILLGPLAAKPERSGAQDDIARPADRPALPSPARFSGAGDGSPGGIAALLHGVTRSLAWYRLANAAAIHPDGLVTATVTGARTVELTLVPDQIEDSQADLALYRWGFDGADPGRLEAVRQAASLALVNQRDLQTAAGPALRTARSLYELSRRGAVGEALAARRAARDAALSASRQAAAAARQASGKAIERVLLQAAALAAVLLTRSGNVISTGTALLLAAVIAAVTVASWAITALVEVPSALAGLEAELEDLGQYRDTLSQDDIDAIRNLQAVGTAKTDLRRARRAVHAVYGTLIAGVCGTCIALAAPGTGPGSNPQPAPSISLGTSATPPSAPSAAPSGPLPR